MSNTASQQDRFNRVVRLFKILARVQASAQGRRRCTLQMLAEECHCSTKTIQRDLEYWREMDVYIEHNGNTYELHGQLPFHVLEISKAEALALALTEAAATAAADVGASNLLQNALSKVHALAPPDIVKTIEDVKESVIAHESAQRDYSDAPLHALLDACRRRVRIVADYESHSSGRREREMDIFRIAFISGFWFVIARDPRKGQAQSFALDRFHSCRPKSPEYRYTVPERWNLAEYMRHSVGVLHGTQHEVSLLFDAESAHWVRARKWRFHPDLVDAGNGTLRMTATVAGLDEIAREVLQWGRHVTVEAPEELRRRIRDEARAIAAKYGN